MRKIALAIAILFFVSMGSADIKAEIKTSCNFGEEPVISISDPDKAYSHAAEPGYYDNQLCIDGIESSEIQENECTSTSGIHLTDREDNAHFSVFSSYRLNVCIGDMRTRITPLLGSCNENETALFSISGKVNAHVAGPDFFDRNVCGSFISPENVSLSIQFNLSSNDEVYFDDEKVEGEQTFEEADYPYLVSQDSEMVSGIVKSEFDTASRRINSENILKMRTKRNASSFIIPFTEGDISDIENREELVTQREFLNQFEPNFAYLLPESPTVRVIYDPDLELDSNISMSPQRYQLDLVKTGEESIGIYTTDEGSSN